MDKPALLYPVVKELNTDVASAGMIRNSLTSEALARRRSRKIYKRAASWSTSISASTAVLGAVVSATICINTRLRATIPLACTSIFLGVLSGAGGLITKFFVRKAAKHSHIELLALSRYDAIAALVSAGLEDGRISESEFHNILDEHDHFNCLLRKLAEDRGDTSLPLREEAMDRARHESLAKVGTELGA